MKANTDRILSMIDSAVAGSAPFLPVRLIVFPEFAHAAPVFTSASELFDKLAVEIPNEHTDRLERKAQEHGIYIQSGSMIEIDRKWTGAVFNTTCLIGPEGILYKYRSQRFVNFFFDSSINLLLFSYESIFDFDPFPSGG